MATSCYGDATFFLFAQQRAGERRASAAIPALPVLVGRTLTTVLNAQACVNGNGTGHSGRRMSLASR